MSKVEERLWLNVVHMGANLFIRLLVELTGNYVV